MAHGWGGLVEHPVQVVVARIHAELDTVVDAGVWTMQPRQLGDTLVSLGRLKARVEELELRVAMGCERAEVEGADASTSTAVWWAVHTRQTRKAAMAAMRLAEALDWDHEPVRDALAAGDLVVEQARVIVDAVDALSTGPAKDLVDPAVRSLAERELIKLGAEHDAKALRVLGRRILDYVAPDVADAHEAKVLAAEEREAMASARFTMSEDGHGKAYGRFTLPAQHAQMLRKHLMALASPVGKQRRDAPESTTPGVFGPARMGQALMAYIERYPTKNLPTAGGIAADLLVTVTHDTLLSGLGSAQLDTGGVISPALARMMACDAGIIPAVMGGPSEVLDLGRKRRFHTKAQRRALVLQQGLCTADGCDYPPGLCHVHHDTPWSQGGATTTTDARLLCPRHHHRIHDPAYDHSALPNGKITFTRRT
jgi:hypothetical protein